MYKVKLWFNEHRKLLWKIIGVVVFFLLLIRILNYLAGKEIKRVSTDSINQNISTSAKNEYNELTISSDKSALSGEEIANSQKESLKTIDLFFDYCNKGKVNEAYNLLTDNCKTEMYPELKYFKNNYYKTVFNGKKKDISIENWIRDTYKVEITDDILSSGNFDENSIRRDYITIKKIDNEYKLNINGYIDTVDINESDTFYSNIDINVVKKDIYMGYEVYTFKIKNNFASPILMDNLKNIDSMYLKDKNNMTYSAYTHEISSSELLINARETREFKIKYYSKYSSEKTIKSIVFSRVIIDYYSYWYTKDSNTFNNYRDIQIEL